MRLAQRAFKVQGSKFKVQGSRLRLSERRVMLASAIPSVSRLDRRSKFKKVQKIQQ